MTPFRSAFRSLGNINYRIWAIGSFVSNVGTWFQRVAQDWLVLTELTQQSATALGIVTALQTAPMLLLMPVTGFAADFFDRRKLLIATQVLQAVLALGLGVLALSGECRLWHVYLFATLFGCVTAFDAPARQAFASDLVDDADLSNAVSLNSTSFNLARMVGPAVAGLVIAVTGSGWAIIINGISFAAVMVSLLALRTGELRIRERASFASNRLSEGFRYVWRRHDLRTVLLVIFMIGTFGLNFSIFISTMTAVTFGSGASRFGLLTSLMAIGSVVAGLVTALSAEPRLKLLLGGTLTFGVGLLLAALAPNIWLFGLAMALVGGAAVSVTTLTMSYMQVTTEPAMRGRMLSIRLAVGMGCTPLGAPIIGWIADAFSPRWAITVGAASGFAAALCILLHIAKGGGRRGELGQVPVRTSREAP